jgi:hypothetical protein
MFNRIKTGHKDRKSAFSRILIYIYYSFSHVGYRKQGYFCPCALKGDCSYWQEEKLMETVFAWLIILGGLYGFVLLICNLIVDGIKFKDFIKSRRKNHHD